MHLDHSVPHKAYQMHTEVRAAWEEPSVAARAAEEAAAYRVPRLDDVIQTGISAAALRGRLKSGAKGFDDFQRLKVAEVERYDTKRQQYEEQMKEGRGRVMQGWEDHILNAKADWAKKAQDVERRGGLTPGQYAANARRRRAM